jgi:Short C-terminal domain
MSNDDQLQALERLAKLRDSGALSEDEFAAKKAAILNEAATVHAPFYRRLWFVVLLTCLILTFPIALIILLTGDVYKKAGGTRTPIGNKARYIYASILGLWLAAAIIKAIIDPSELKMDTDKKTNVSPSSQSASSANSASAPETNQAAAPAPAEKPEAASNNASESPTMLGKVEQTQNGQVFDLTADDDKPFTVLRLVFNGRENEPACDLPKFQLDPTVPANLANQAGTMQGAYGTHLPVTMKRGDQAVFFSGCGNILLVDIYTDRGTSEIKFDDANH